MNQEIEKLLALEAEGELDQKQAGELLRRCREDADLGRRLVRLTQVERLATLAVNDDGEVFVREFRCRLEAEKEADQFSSVIAGRLRRGKVVKVLMGVAAVFVMCLVGFEVFFKEKGGFVVRLAQVEATDWVSEREQFKIGDRITFKKGLIEVVYFSGVRVVLEAPADFEITGRNSGFLHEGKLVAEVDDERAHGFVIDGPSGRLVDLGTKFAVAVQKSGAMEVHVMEGEVDATATGGEASSLGKDEAMQLENGQAVSMEMDSGKFVTRMPSYLSEPPRSVRWRFDGEGDRVKNTGNGLASRNADGRLISYSGKGSGPKRIEGVFGKGLSFDGADSFVESDFEGVGGGAPRTVAFWVKAPEDFNKLQGYGMISWGDKKVSGGAWQISVNGTAGDGPLGRLRIGTHRGQVIGTTDLRDGKWHHCAVVMYGDESDEPNTSTHILLYVDGGLEPAARKSVRVVNTMMSPEREGARHGVWMGRNLGFESERRGGRWNYGRFFRGEIDEMVICAIALSRAQIQRLMEKNEMPE